MVCRISYIQTCYDIVLVGSKGEMYHAQLCCSWFRWRDVGVLPICIPLLYRKMNFQKFIHSRDSSHFFNWILIHSVSLYLRSIQVAGALPFAVYFRYQGIIKVSGISPSELKLYCKKLNRFHVKVVPSSSSLTYLGEGHCARKHLFSNESSETLWTFAPDGCRWLPRCTSSLFAYTQSGVNKSAHTHKFTQLAELVCYNNSLLRSGGGNERNFTHKKDYSKD